MDDEVALARRVLDSQPFSALMGAQLTAFERGLAELSVPVRRDLLQQHGFVHGGVISYAADNALTFAGGSVLGPAVVTAEFKINYLRPARGARLVARASVVHAGRRQAVCRSEVFDVRESRQDLCAVALGTIVRLSEGEGGRADVNRG